MEEVSVHVIEAVLRAAKHHKILMHDYQQQAEHHQRSAVHQKEMADVERAKLEQCADWLSKNAVGLELDF